MKRFKDKVAIVTGGASGIGLATIREFFAEGAKVVIADFSDKGADIAAEFNQERSESALFIKVDVSQEEQVKNLFIETVKFFGKVDIVFANAGIADQGRITDISLADWDRIMGVNLTGVFLTDKFAVEQFLAQGSPGVIINCGSAHSLVAKTGITAYPAAKGGVKMLTQTLANDYAKDGIRVNTVAPGYIETPIIARANSEAKERLVSLHPMGRLGEPREIARGVLFLASEDASFITGTILPIDGGYTSV